MNKRDHGGISASPASFRVQPIIRARLRSASSRRELGENVAKKRAKKKKKERKKEKEGKHCSRRGLIA
jgi:hypothetical protein